jgi:pullulanase/glycogen debranching enzyme
VSAHDNETLFDAIQLKASAETLVATRARMAGLGLGLVLLSQGVPFIHAGDELLRSKSLDRNSYNSGDWFNRIDWTYQTNNWGVGLPAEGDNKEQWPLMQPLLANPALKPAPEDIRRTLATVQDLLKIRKGSQLFRMRTAAEVQQKLSFLNNGPAQIPGLIVMRLQSDSSTQADTYSQIVAVFNGTATTQVYSDTLLQGAELALHPVQAGSTDPVVKIASFERASGTLSVPAYTVAVFVGPPVQVLPTATPAPTDTPVPPTATPVPPTATAQPPTATPAPPTATPTPTPAPVLGAGSSGLLAGLALLAAAVGGFVYLRRRR